MMARGIVKGVIEAGFDPADKIAIFRIPGSWRKEGFAILKKYGVESSSTARSRCTRRLLAPSRRWPPASRPALESHPPSRPRLRRGRRS
ncbi:MAG: hypothetical protein U0360_06980 [Dehalococcoidia bacterium]